VALGVDRAAGRVTQPFGTPGARHDGAAFASVKRVDVINIAAPIADAGRAIDNNNERIALTSKKRRAQETSLPALECVA
jgi:hypothetical protein